MKVRIKFKKYGVMRFIGHLDIMRYFQKCIRRAGIDIAYSGGFSPHQIMSFASPLGVGICSEGEYFDIELNSHHGSKEMIDCLNKIMVPGMEILSVKALLDETINAMASVSAAKYNIILKDQGELETILKESIESFINQNQILVTKQTKKNEAILDIKPHIYEFIAFNNGFILFVDASSSGNIKPSLVLESYFQFCNLTYESNKYQITRLDTYTNISNNDKKEFVPLDSVGVDF